MTELGKKARITVSQIYSAQDAADFLSDAAASLGGILPGKRR